MIPCPNSWAVALDQELQLVVVALRPGPPEEVSGEEVVNRVGVVPLYQRFLERLAEEREPTFVPQEHVLWVGELKPQPQVERVVHERSLEDEGRGVCVAQHLRRRTVAERHGPHEVRARRAAGETRVVDHQLRIGERHGTWTSEVRLRRRHASVGRHGGADVEAALEGGIGKQHAAGEHNPHEPGERRRLDPDAQPGTEHRNALVLLEEAHDLETDRSGALLHLPHDKALIGTALPEDRAVTREERLRLLDGRDPLRRHAERDEAHRAGLRAARQRHGRIVLQRDEVRRGRVDGLRTSVVRGEDQSDRQDREPRAHDQHLRVGAVTLGRGVPHVMSYERMKRGRLHETFAQRASDRLGLAVHLQLAVHAPDVGAYRADADVHRVGGLLVG
jgi:hypothetical protein